MLSKKYRAIRFFIFSILCYGILSYFVLPSLWIHYEHHPPMRNAPKTTQTKEGIPGDPINIALIGNHDVLIHAMHAAGWVPADPITLKTSLEIAGSIFANRSYLDAPVSNLYLWGRKQDLVFEKPAGKNPSKRHHVRFWKSAELGTNDGPLWIGAATFDKNVGISYRTGQITHHIDPDVDAERNFLIQDLRNAQQLSAIFQVTGIGLTLLGKNGSGDRYFTDGELTIGILSPDNQPVSDMRKLPNPALVEFKNKFLTQLKNILS